MAADHPWTRVQNELGERTDYWSDLRFKHRARNRDEACDAVDRLVEAAERLGFAFELGRTEAHPPRD